MPAKCPPGKIKRNAYTRSDGVFVKSSCVPDKGKPGKTLTKNKILPKPLKGGLSQYGYSNIKNTTASVRREALRIGVKDIGYAPIIRRVNLISNYNKLSDPKTHNIMRSDIAWMQKVLAPLYSKTALKKASRATKKPSRVTKKPSRVTKKPSRATKKPSRVTKKPSRVTKKPSRVTKKPSRVTKKPSRATKKPSRVTKKPSRATKKPSRVTKKPSRVTKKPSRVTKKPSRVTKKPSRVTKKKAGTKIIAGRSRQLYKTPNGIKKFYQYRKKDGSLGRKYVQ